MDIQPYSIQIFRVIPGSSWVELNQVGYGYYPNFSGRVWILSKPDPQKKKKKPTLSSKEKSNLYKKKKRSTRCQMSSPPSRLICLPHTKSKPSNPNLATMVKKFMEKKPSSSSSKVVKMVIPLDVIAEE